ncbi:hypothetical protein SPHINGO391_440151 [Sphingomonas aurantiaca]|uniref:Uncharacterized protein n=1 Tax=Sphingomonas aurantiaca TaxID=185949 RepID=A0A5E7Z3T4_9SPHN|nr:hypothetical protein SPHINGO391_440151 [Sphingomonas aurantiaca]
MPGNHIMTELASFSFFRAITV